MLVVNLKSVQKTVGERCLLKDAQLQVKAGERIGIVGENGAGKTTLLKLIVGETSPDAGTVSVTPSYAYIPQLENETMSIEQDKVSALLASPQQFASYLSGGEKIKLKLVQALQTPRHLLIADEPTANLDRKSIAVVESLLQAYQGAVLLVSHDRTLLDRVCTKIIELEQAKLTVYHGNYTAYEQLKRAKIEQEQAEYAHYRAEQKRLETSRRETLKQSEGLRKAPKRMGNSEARIHKMGDQRGRKHLDAKSKAIQTRIEQLEVKHKPIVVKPLRIDVPKGLEMMSKNAFAINQLTVDVDGKCLFDSVSFKVKREQKVALIGENGSGKTTLLRLIAQRQHPAITYSPRAQIGYFDQQQASLDEEASILANVQAHSSFAETFIRTHLAAFGFQGPDVEKRVALLSGGERVKVALCQLILGENNVLVLDEPTNYLDVYAVRALEAALKATAKTVLLVSHDRSFIQATCEQVLEIKNHGIKPKQAVGSAPVSKSVRSQAQRRIVLENQLSLLISRLSLATNEQEKSAYEQAYQEVLTAIQELKTGNKA